MSNYDITLELVYAKKNKRSILAQRRISYKNYRFDDPEPNSVYKGVERTIKLPDYDSRPAEYWKTLRHTPLSKHEEDIFVMIDSVKRVPIVKTTVKLIGIISSGYFTVGKFDVGPIVSTASFNTLEGLRLRVGGQTNWNFNRHLYLSAYGAYGFKDREPKYEARAMYSFPKKKYYPWDYPIDMLQVSYSYDVKTPGQSFLYGSSDKLYLSFVRGKSDKIMYERKFELSWTKENPSGFSWKPNIALTTLYPKAALRYEDGHGRIHSNITYNEIGLFLRYAPNERFFQILMGDRFPLNQTQPIIELGHKAGFANIAGGQYSYNRTDATLYKRWWIGGFGHADIWLKAGQVWNAVPYPLLITPQANQAFAYQDEAYNMMNYMEFLTDRYASANLSYGFNGFIANRLPVIRKLKLREFVTFKIFWGALDRHNQPEHNPDLFRFPDGTFPLDPKRPYMEASFAIDNIFKVLRIDFIRRLSYFENPNIPSWSVRFRIRPSF